MKTVKERKLFESTQYLITIAMRLLGDLPYGIEKECYFISLNVIDALKNIGTKQSRSFVKELKKANLQKKFYIPQLTKRNNMSKTKIELGKRYRDKIHGLTGVAAVLSAYLTGCDRVGLEYLNNDGEVKTHYIDVSRVELIEEDRNEQKKLNKDDDNGGPGDAPLEFKEPQ